MRDAGRVAIVTGGATGIGQAVAFAFAQRGVRVVIAGRRGAQGEETVRQIHGDGGEAVFVRTDVARSADVAALVEQTVQRYGRLDYACHSAGATEPLTSLVDLREEDFDHTMAVNLKGVWLCMKYEIPAMLQSGGGAIVNISSVNSGKVASAAAAYSASKAGVDALTRAAALGYAREGIRVNAISAGAFRTPMLEGVFDRISHEDHEMAAAQYEAQIPMGRLGDTAEIASAVVWICSDAASYLTGHCLAVDGGLLAT
jgi:NAD(P)-dependent dehydrogenase (short-subunit alcohol dehydrogenase family)